MSNVCPLVQNYPHYILWKKCQIVDGCMVAQVRCSPLEERHAGDNKLVVNDDDDTNEGEEGNDGLKLPRRIFR